MERYLTEPIRQDLQRKVVFISGPRQSGKTTLAKQLYKQFDYLNYDAAQDRLMIQNRQWDRDKPLVIFDELHKKDQWKQWLKGIYDKEGIQPQLLVTGSARLDLYRQVGDSMAGRFFEYRLYPIDIKEAVDMLGLSPEQALDRLWATSGFPEPFLANDPVYYKRWRRSYLDIILKQDLIDLYAVRYLKDIETLILLLRERVGGTVSYEDLAADLQRDASTVKRWLVLLENLYVIFRVQPYHNKVARSLRKESKFYFYDWTYVTDKGARLENLVACTLLKRLHLLTDLQGDETGLYYLRTRDGHEIDFLTTIDQKPQYMLEVKNKDTTISSSFSYFRRFLPQVTAIQLVRHCPREFANEQGVRVKSLAHWLADLRLSE